MRRPFLAALVVATLACDHGRTPESESFTWRSTLAPGRSIQIRNLNGTIEVHRGSGEQVEVTAVKRYRGPRPQEVRFVTGTDANGAVICAVWGRGNDCQRLGSSGGSRHFAWSRLFGGKGNVTVNFTVLVPPGVHVDVGTTNGAVRVDGVRGGVRASTVNGGVRIAAASGPVTASSVNGSVSASLDSLDAAAPLSLTTVNGSVTAELPEGVDATLEMSTVNGRVNADFPVTVQGSVSPKRLRGTLGSGGREIKLETVNGGVTLKRRGAA